MSVVKFTKTSTFLFPLLGIPKTIFSCDVKNSFGTVMFKNRFVNCYLYHEDIVADGCLFVVVRGYQDAEFSEFYKKLVSIENYVDDFEKNEYFVFIFSILEKFQEDFDIIIQGKYSEVSGVARKEIFKNHFFSTNSTVLPMIFFKAKSLKDMWEEQLSNPGINYIADLGDQEVWSIIDSDKETLTEDIFRQLIKFRKSVTIKEKV